MRVSRSLSLTMLMVLTACASKRPGTSPDNEPTLRTLAGRPITVDTDRGIPASTEKAIAAYKNFLETAPRASQRSQALRRLGDLEMDSADERVSSGQGSGTAADYKAAVTRYQDFLKTYPNDPDNDRVLYQLARAHEQGGELEASLQTLDTLVAKYPATRFAEEAQFRRGEMLFSMRHYAKAEQAFDTVLKAGGNDTYRDRALYMHGWSIFKQDRLEDALASFFGVLDSKLDGIDKAGESSGELDTLNDLSRADRELVEDTFRVTSLCLQNLKGAESIPAYLTSDARRAYAFRVYQQLGELYIKQERVKDAADTYGAFARSNPLHAQAPQLQTRVIEIYQQGGFDNLALEAKKEYVVRYGVDSEFRRANPAGWEKAQPLVKTHLTELAKHHHALAQTSHASADSQEAVRWYREFLKSFPTDPEAAQNNFLLAELLFEDQRYAEAAVEYEKVAYDHSAHAKSADAGYAALLSYAAQEKRSPADATRLQRAGVDSALRFADKFPADTRNGAVLTNAADRLFTLRDDRASAVARRVLALNSAATPAQRRVAWTVVAHTAFDRGAYADSERAYAEVLALAPTNDAARAELVERQAASIYRQGEQARTAGNLRDAVGHFNRVSAAAPQSSVRPNAQYDAAAALIALKDWDAATKNLEDFRQRYPSHPLQGEVNSKLALAYLEKSQWPQAAAEFERLAATSTEPQVARSAAWQAAELYDKGGSRPAAARAYERYVKTYPSPLEPAIEARYRLAQIAKKDGDAVREASWMKSLYQADREGGSARTDRTKTLGGLAALAMAEPALASYKQVALVEPLARQLKLKKSRMEDALKAYAAAADYGVAEVSTAATFHTASLYQDFGHALITSQRPKKLSKAELEQYDVMLEEQAYPFEEKAIELHEVNTKRAAQGVYDSWVRASFKALGELRGVRYNKSERSEGVIDAIR